MQDDTVTSVWNQRQTSFEREVEAYILHLTREFEWFFPLKLCNLQMNLLKPVIFCYNMFSSATLNLTMFL